MRKLYILLFILLVTNGLYAQSIAEIKANPEIYLWGEGRASTLNRADEAALQSLISQISVSIESKFTLIREEVERNGKSNFSEQTKHVMSTYSRATLTNAERLIEGEEPDIKVTRFIKRKEVNKVFAERKAKILDFTQSAHKAFRNGQITDALKNSSWALLLLRSHPEGGSITYTYENDEQTTLISYLPMFMNRVLASLSFSVQNIVDETNKRVVELIIKSDDKLVTNFDFSYWEGRDWSPIATAQDGVGVAELYGENLENFTEIRIRAECIFENEMVIDNDVREVYRIIEPMPFRSSYFNIRLDWEQAQAAESIRMLIQPETTEAIANSRSIADISLTEPQNPEPYIDIVNRITASLKTRSFANIDSLFTTEGYNTFTQLLNYGNARLVSNNEVKAIQYGETVMCRGPKMNFSFQNNTRTFVESIIFHFNSKGKIEYLNFGLGDVATTSILKKETWSEVERMAIINFLECYKTAYALKRLDYLETIFADDALIVVGNVVKVQPNADNTFRDNSLVKYNRFNKQQFINHLRYSFASKEFINLTFEESDIVKAGASESKYGIQIKQNYYSSNYGDQGYLFLLIDLEIPDKPLIHVRTWQPQKNADGSIIGIYDF